jgi:hypothetical protein
MREERDESVRPETTTVVDERVETQRTVAPGPPLDEPELEQAVVRETETVRSRDDGVIERDTVREEHRRRSRSGQIWIVVAILALVAAAAARAW